MNASTTTLGEDASGNGNDWTLTGFTVDDSVEDTPTNVFPTLNVLALGTSQLTLSEANLKADPASGASNWGTAMSSIALPSSGQFYAEGRAFVAAGSGNIGGFGVVDALVFTASNSAILHTNTAGEGFDGILCHLFSDYVSPIADGVQGANVTGVTATSVIMMLAMDIDTGKIWAGYDGSWLNSGDPVAGTGETATRAFSATDMIAGNTSWNGANDQGFEANFGQKPFAHTPPSGFLALSTANLENPDQTSPLTGSFTGNANADGPFVYLGYPPDQAGTCTINGNAITWGTHADALANGFKLRTSSASYNASGTNTYSIAIDPDASFADNANAQVN